MAYILGPFQQSSSFSFDTMGNCLPCWPAGSVVPCFIKRQGYEPEGHGCENNREGQQETALQTQTHSRDWNKKLDLKYYKRLLGFIVNSFKNDT